MENIIWKSIFLRKYFPWQMIFREIHFPPNQTLPKWKRLDQQEANIFRTLPVVTHSSRENRTQKLRIQKQKYTWTWWEVEQLPIKSTLIRKKFWNLSQVVKIEVLSTLGLRFDSPFPYSIIMPLWLLWTKKNH